MVLLSCAVMAAGASVALAREAVFFVGAHPDDTEGYAATAFLLREKYDIHVIDLTRGELGLGPAGLKDGSTAKVRTAEETAACAYLGATPHFLHEVDGFAYASKASVDALAELLRQHKPKAVFTHWPVDTHCDHVQTAAVVARALKETGMKPERYFYEVLMSQTKNWHPIYSVDVSATITNKQEMLRKYACQNENDGLVKEKTAQAKARGRQRVSPCAFAETFTTYDGEPIAGGVLASLNETSLFSGNGPDEGNVIARTREKAHLFACRKAFLDRMSEKAKELGLSVSHYENASGLTKKSRTSAADLLKIGKAVLAQPALAAAWAETNVTVSVLGAHARTERLVHGYTKLKGYRAFAEKYPFLGGKGGSLSYSDLSVRAHVLLTEVGGSKLLIAISGQKCGDDSFAVDLAICDRVAAELRGEKPAASPVLAALDELGAGYAYATLDGKLSFASEHAEAAHVPASTTKIVTALCCLDVVKDLSQTLTVRAIDISGGSGFKCYEGDVMTCRDALLAMMLPSSNTIAESVATNVGELLLKK